MKRILLFILAISFSLSPFAQKKTNQKSAKTTVTTSHTKKRTVQQQKKTRTSKTNAAPTKAERRAATNNNASIRGLQGQRASIQKKIKEQEKALRANQEDVKKRLQDLMILNGEIDQRQKNIEGIQKDIHYIEGNIGILNAQLKTLEQQLQDRKNKYIRSMRYMTRHHSVQEKLMFIFSAKSLSQMYRRLSFVRQYSAYQKAQGEAVKSKQTQVNDKHKQLQNVKGHKSTLLYKGQQEKTVLESKQNEQQQMVQGLQKQQKTIQAVIADQRQKDAAINAQIDHLIAQEVAKARARAAAEAQRKAAAAAAAKKKKAEELARKKAAAEAAARENARRIAEAKRKEAEAEAARRKAAEEARLAQEAARKAQEEAQAQAEAKAKERAQAQAKAKAEAAAEQAARQAAAEQAARKAEAERQAAELKAKADEVRNKKEIAEAKQEVQETSGLSSVDRMLSGGFEANRGRLPMPITGSYRVISHFGQYNVQGLSGVTLDNKGINIQGKSGCMARSIYDGEVSAVFGYGGMWNVLVRHGAYISVYCNLKSVSVHKGQKISARQTLGAVGTDNILQFQLRKETAKLNPEAWLGS